MILQVEDLYTAIDRGWEALAKIQLDIAKRSRVSGDVTVYNQKQKESVRLYANITTLASMPFNHNIEKNKEIKALYNNIKLMTKNFKRWD